MTAGTAQCGAWVRVPHPCVAHACPGRPLHPARAGTTCPAFPSLPCCLPSENQFGISFYLINRQNLRFCLLFAKLSPFLLKVDRKASNGSTARTFWSTANGNSERKGWRRSTVSSCTPFCSLLTLGKLTDIFLVCTSRRGCKRRVRTVGRAGVNNGGSAEL